MAQRNVFWLFTVDLNRGRLLRLSLTEHNRPHVEDVAELTNEWKTVEHGRPSPLAGKNAKTHAVPPATDDDRRYHFAKEVAQWLGTQIQRQNIDTLHLHAASRFLGELRKVLPRQVRDRLVEHEGDLTPMPNNELRKHPAVTELLGVSASR